MKVAIIGSRECEGLTLKKVLENIPKDATAIISGGAVGADSFAKQAAAALKLPFEEFLPEYETFGKLAPIVRNKTIVDKADLIIAFWDYESKGTKNALLEGIRLDKKIVIVELDKPKQAASPQK